MVLRLTFYPSLLVTVALPVELSMQAFKQFTMIMLVC